jgi:hypothetical protein
MNKPWSDLPNARYIDWVLASMKENPELWAEATRSAARPKAWKLARSAAWHAARDKARDKAWDAARAAEWDAGRYVLFALFAYDDCDQYLALDYEKLKLYAALSEKPQAILLLPMVYVREKIKMP